MLLAMQFTRAESVHEAFDMFRKNGTAFFRHYPNENDRLPENADKCFNIFFDGSASLRTEKLVQKLLERENNDLKKSLRKIHILTSDNCRPEKSLLNASFPACGGKTPLNTSLRKHIKTK